MELQLAVQSFLLDRKAARLKETTIQWYRFMLLRFADGIELTQIEEVEPLHIRQYLSDLQDGESWNDASQHGMARALRAFFNWAADDELIPTSPMKKVCMPKRDRRILPSFTPEEVRRLLSICRCQRDKAMVLFLLDTGLRATENLELLMGDVDMEQRTVFVRLGKGGKDRFVYFGKRCEQELWRYFKELGRIPREDERLWLSHHGKPLKIWGQRMIFRRLAERSGIAHCSAHTFLRTFALWALRSNMDLYTLQRLMGHADLATLQQYLNLDQSDLIQAHKNHGPVDNHL